MLSIVPETINYSKLVSPSFLQDTLDHFFSRFVSFLFSQILVKIGRWGKKSVRSLLSRDFGSLSPKTCAVLILFRSKVETSLLVLRSLTRSLKTTWERSKLIKYRFLAISPRCKPSDDYNSRSCRIVIHINQGGQHRVSSLSLSPCWARPPQSGTSSTVVNIPKHRFCLARSSSANT